MRSTFKEVRLEVHVEDVAAQTLDGVVEGQDVDALAVLDIETLVHIDEIAKLDAQVVARDLVHLYPALLDIVGAQADQDSVAPLLATIQTYE